MTSFDQTELIEALLHTLVRQCIDIERLACFEQFLIDAMTADDRDRERVTHLVQDQIDHTWQGLMFEFERIRDADCAACARYSDPALSRPT